ncbi:NACHT domain-containing protein [Stieleria neptunia]|uniref:NACHT domain-containing protein n=1 Tax=Stieleria neptunia TaxID=2527979 RepID=UPI0018D22A4E|nr:NACHT domain-containing protein [Stieleria neptunia]
MEPDYWVIVEASKSTTLEKLRTDLAKFQAVRPALLTDNIYSKCYFVTQNEPSEGLITTGNGFHVNVMSFKTFSKELINHEVYRYAREARPFGSSVNPFNGESDPIEYVPVEYSTIDGTQTFDIAAISKRLSMGKRFVLLGEYGTGKSRCLRQIFHQMAIHAQEACMFPFAIDLRRHWGAKSGEEIVRRHFQDLGLSEYTDSILRAYTQGGVVFLLDGFDEIGSQAWSDKTSYLRAIRREAVVAIRDLIESSKGGVIVTGRHHFFDSNEEMLDCLGLIKAEDLVVYAPNEFSKEQMETYLTKAGIKISVPSWLPKRPLIGQVIASINAEEQSRIFLQEASEVAFWKEFVSVLCKREARIHHALHAEGIHSILKRLARITRQKPSNVGPISLNEVNQVFAELAGTLPVDESTAMLQRLPGLGRLSAESSDRQFVDAYILDGLRGDDLVDCLRKVSTLPLKDRFIHPLGSLGISIVTSECLREDQQRDAVYVARQLSESNPTFSSDIIAALAVANATTIDTKGMVITNGEFSKLDLTQENLVNLTLVSCVLHQLYLPESQPTNLFLKDCLVSEAFGISAAKPSLPPWLSSCSAERIHHMDTLDRIKQADLSPSELILVTILKKTFFQPGAGRKEEALMRGLGDLAKPGVAQKIVNRLLQEEILTQGPGRSGRIYRPNRSQTDRVGKIVADLGKSIDPIWEFASKLT